MRRVALVLFFFVSISVAEEQKCFRILPSGKGKWGSCEGELRGHRPLAVKQEELLSRQQSQPELRRHDGMHTHSNVVSIDAPLWNKTFDSHPWVLLFISNSSEPNSTEARSILEKASSRMHHCLHFGVMETNLSEENAKLASHFNISTFPTFIHLSSSSGLSLKEQQSGFSFLPKKPSSEHSSKSTLESEKEKSKIRIMKLGGRYFRTLSIFGKEDEMIEVVENPKSPTGWSDVISPDRSQYKKTTQNNAHSHSHSHENTPQHDHSHTEYTNSANKDQSERVTVLYKHGDNEIISEETLLKSCGKMLSGFIKHIHTTEEMTNFFSTKIHLLKVLLIDTEELESVGALQLFVSDLAKHDLDVAYTCSPDIAGRLREDAPALIVAEYPFDNWSVKNGKVFSEAEIGEFVRQVRKEHVPTKRLEM